MTNDQGKYFGEQRDDGMDVIGSPLDYNDFYAKHYFVKDGSGKRMETLESAPSAYQTAQRYAPELGMRGVLALGVHRVFSMRTRLLYRWLKP